MRDETEMRTTPPLFFKRGVLVELLESFASFVTVNRSCRLKHALRAQHEVSGRIRPFRKCNDQRRGPLSHSENKSRAKPAESHKDGATQMEID